MPDFTRRSAEPEIMDEAGLSYAEFEDCLRELETINRWTFAYRPTLQWLRQFQDRRSGLKILDVGSGRGDMLRQIARRCRIPARQLTGLDLNPWSRRAAIAAAPNVAINYETGDLFACKPASPPDLIISALFTHHLPEPALIAFLQWMDVTATRGWLINDLHRHWLPYWFIKLATRLCSRNRLIRHDAAVSVARAFTRQDWETLLAKAGIARDTIAIRWWFPFRYTVACRKR